MTQQPLERETLARLILDSEPWLSCDDCFRHVDAYVEMLIDGTEDRMPRMAVHLRGCPACVEEAETVLVLAAEDSGLDPGPALDRLGRLVALPPVTP